jgi:hypothetical protein
MAIHCGLSLTIHFRKFQQKKLKDPMFLQNSRHWQRLFSFLYLRVGSAVVARIESSKQS